MNIVFIGGGNMASAMIHGLVKDPSNKIAVVEPFAATREVLLHSFGARIDLFESAELAKTKGAFTQQLPSDSKIVVLAVKPQVMPEVAKGLANFVQQALVLSVAAGIRMQDLSRWLGGHARIIRAMPNTPALIGMGIAGLVASSASSASDKAMAEKLLKSVGEVVWLADEGKIDAVTALSGSGPAYVFLVIEAMQAAGQAMGLSQEQASTLAKHTVRGAAELAQRSNEPPNVLRDRVTSKGGTTAAALAVMQEQGLIDIFAKALKAAEQRGVQMGEEFGRQV